MSACPAATPLLQPAAKPRLVACRTTVTSSIAATASIAPPDEALSTTIARPPKRTAEFTAAISSSPPFQFTMTTSTVTRVD